jgi:hypothetical protein
MTGLVDRPLSRRDWLLLPGVSLLTALTMTASAETFCRIVWPDNESDICASPTGNRPNCVVRMKNAEGPEYEYRFNECGYRSETSCREKPPGTTRLVSMGTSIGMGLFVPAQDLFANRAAKELGEMLHRPVEAQNMASLSQNIRAIPGQVSAALALRPDAIVFEICPYDLLSFAGFGTPAEAANGVRQPGAGETITLAARIRFLMRESRFGFMAQHSLLTDDAFLYRTYANYGDPNDVLAQPPSAECERQWAGLGELFGELDEKLRGTGIPVFIVPIPTRLAAGMISDDVHIPNRDPEAFQRRLALLADAHGMFIVDTARYFRSSPHAERLYYPVDSHPGPQAHSLLGHALAMRMAEQLGVVTGPSSHHGA